MIIKTRIASINIPIDNLVVHWRAAGPLVDTDIVSAIEALIVVLDILVVHVAVDGPIAVDVVHIHVAMDYVSVNEDVVIAIVHVDVGDVDARTGPADPSPAFPTMIVNAMVMPVAIAIEPGANDETSAESDGQSPCGPTVIADIGIVNRHVDVCGLIRNDADVIVFDEYLLLRRADEVADIVSHVAQALDRGHHVRGLIDVGLSEGSGPVNFVSHHVNHSGIVSDGPDADVPRLIVYAVGASRANPACSFVDVIHKSGGDEDLRKQRIGIERNGREKIVELFEGELLIRVVFVLSNRFYCERS